MNYIVKKKASDKIRRFYQNVSKKYKNTYSHSQMLQNMNDALDAILSIENGLIRRTPTIKRWEGLYMATYSVKNKSRWNFAYRIDGDTIYVEDACHAQNMKEDINIEDIIENYYNVLRSLLI